MAIYTRGKSYNVPGRNPRSKVPRRSKMVRKAVKNANKKVFETKVQNVLNKQMEVKQRTIILTENPTGVYNQSIKGGGLSESPSTQKGWNITNLLEKIPIQKGSASTQRIGLAISPKELRLRGYIFASQYNSTTNNNPNPFEVVMVIYKRKNAVSGATNQLKLNANDSSATAITSTPWNDMFEWNRSEFVIKKVRRFKFKAATEIQNMTKPQTETTMTTSIVLNPQTGDARLPMIQRFNIVVPIKKELTYDVVSPETNTPVNDWCSVGFYIVNSDGTTPTASETRAQIYMTGSLKYTDN